MQAKWISNKKTGLVAILAAALILGACGRKGALEPPPGTAAVSEQTGEPTKPQPKRESFFLDFLL